MRAATCLALPRRPFLLLLVVVLVPLFPASAGSVYLSREDEAAIATATSFSRAFSAAAKIIRPAVVNIKVERRVTVRGRGFNNPQEFFQDMLQNPFGIPGSRQPRSQVETQIGQGSGVIVDHKGYILTNNHVVGEADAVRVSLLDGREFPAEIIGADPGSDVAVIKINADNLTVATLGDSDSIEVGEWVLAVGNPFGLDFTVTSGIVSARGRSGIFKMLEMEDFIQTDAVINPGNSGGPMVNLRGEVIGINTGIATAQGGSASFSGVGFAIPANMAKSIMQSLISHKQVTSAYLGVESRPLRTEDARAYGLQSARGALIQSVNRDSPAERAGFRRGDVVVRWGRRDIDDDQQFRNLVIITTPDEPVDVEVIRDGRTALLRVVLEAGTPEAVIEGRSDRFLQNLGIQVADLTPEFRRELGYEQEANGALVTAVDRGSPAREMGFQPGFLIVSVNGKDVRGQQDLKNLLGAIERSKTYTLLVRNGDIYQRVVLEVD